MKVSDQLIASRPTVDFRAVLNPVLIGTVALTVPLTVWLAWRTGHRLAQWAVFWIAATFVPYVLLVAFANRQAFLTYMLPTVPALAVCAALFLRRTSLPRIVTWFYLVATVIAFVVYFPFRQVP